MPGTQQSAFKVPLIGLGILAGIALIYIFAEVFVLLFISILIALIIDPVVSFLENRFVRRGVATTAAFSFIMLFLYLLFAIIVPQLVSQASELLKNLRLDSIKNEVKSVENFLRTVVPVLKENFLTSKWDRFLNQLSLEDALKELPGFVSGLFSFATVLVIVPFLTFFIVKDRKAIIKGLLSLLPNKYFEMSYWIAKKITMQMGRYVRGWLLDAAFVGIACGIAFSLLGVKNAVALGIIAGLGHLIPYFGPIIGGTPALLILLIQHQGNLTFLPFLLLAIGIIYVADNGIVQPYVFSKSVGMHPLTIILLIIAGGRLLGIPGMLFAVPVATIIKTAGYEIYYAYKNYKIARS
jgi:predicted PurR-regulated permease PerM